MPEKEQPNEFEHSVAVDSLLIGGVLAITGISAAIGQTYLMIKEKDYSAVDFSVASGSIALGGAMAYAGVKHIYRGIKHYSTVNTSRQQG